jgi:uncharacterized protein
MDRATTLYEDATSVALAPPPAPPAELIAIQRRSARTDVTPGALRTSGYTIYVALPDNDREMLLVHGYTGAYDKVSGAVAQYLLSLESGPRPKPLYGEWVSEPTLASAAAAPPPSAQTIDRLKRRGYLTTMTAEQEEGYLARLVKRMHQKDITAMPSYLFMPTYNCNLRCSYCFQDHMRTKPAFRHLLRRMTKEKVDSIFAGMGEIERAAGYEPSTSLTRRIGFFGGEPLLADNRPIVEYIMAKARAAGGTHFWGVSNATELEAYEDLLGVDGIRHLQITLDGPAEEHDKRRIYADGSGSFERISRNIDLCLSKDVEIHIRMNIDRNNIDQVPVLAQQMIDRGWDKHPKFAVYTAAIRAANEHTDMRTTFTTWELDQAVDELKTRIPAMRVVGRLDDMMEVRARKVFDTRADTGNDLRTSFCSAHGNMYIFDAFGDIYACWERTGDANVRIGRITDEGKYEINGGMNKLWRTRTVATNPTCRKCRYALHCGGGCAVLAESHSGKFHSNHCDGYADRFRFSVARAYQQYVAGVQVTYREQVCDL